MLDLVIANTRICDDTGRPSTMGTLGAVDGVNYDQAGMERLVAAADLVLFDPDTVAPRPPEDVTK